MRNQITTNQAIFQAAKLRPANPRGPYPTDLMGKVLLPYEIARMLVPPPACGGRFKAGGIRLTCERVQRSERVAHDKFWVSVHAGLGSRTQAKRLLAVLRWIANGGEICSHPGTWDSKHQIWLCAACASQI